MIGFSVSIIIPVYSVSDYIEACISSVIRQNYPHIECIIVDDASPDDSIEKCQRLIANYSGPISFIILHHDHNRGLSAARNTGTDAATGDYVFYLDSDDEIAPYCIEKLVEPLMNDSTIELVQGNYKRMGNRVVYGHHSEVSDTDIANNVCAFSHPYDMNSNKEIRAYYYERNRMGNSVWNKLIRKSFLTNNHIRFKEGLLWEDGLWQFYVMKYLDHLYFVPDYTYIYKIRPHSIMTSTSASDRIGYLAGVYNDIFSHFTPGEEERETSFYLRSFCNNYVSSKGDHRLDDAYYLLWNTFSDGKHFKARMLLSLVRVISRYSVGRWLYKQVLKKYRSCRHLYKRII